MARNTGTDVVAALGIITLSTLLIAALVVYQGFALSILWGWFVAVKFGLPTLKIAEAVGLSLTVSAFSPPAKETAGAGILGITVALILGFILKCFI